MAFSYKKTLVIVVVVVMMFTILAEFGAACRPLSSQDDQWPRQFGYLLSSVKNNAPAPPSGGNKGHP
ncbi:hypothetical protein SESBI_16572 [Sesbania bispinosa]|nr:hypothetical protein SESBI_16572 [Sesbania bispinosa]